MIDWTRVTDLRAEIGNDEFPEVAALFLDEVDTVIARLRAADPATVGGEDLHFLKGSALTLGFTALADACAQGEARLSGGTAADIPALVGVFDASRAAFLAGLVEHGVQMNL